MSPRARRILDRVALRRGVALGQMVDAQISAAGAIGHNTPSKSGDREIAPSASRNFSSKRRGKPKIAIERIRRAVAMRAEGKTHPQIATELGISRQSVGVYLKTAAQRIADEASP